jgi:hypothetical protein
MAQQATIRTAFASPKDAARIYGVSLNHLKDLMQSLNHVIRADGRNLVKEKTEKADVKMKSAKRSKTAAKRKSVSRSAKKRVGSSRTARKARRAA